MKQGRIALVTGGTGGIGSAICEALFHAGIRIVAGYNNDSDSTYALEWQEAMRAKGLDIEIAYGDVASAASTAAMVAEIEAQVGPIAILVNNAGVTRDRSLKKMSEEEWQQVLRVNLDSVFHTSRCVIESMIEKGFGRIINISSVNGQKGQWGQTNYAASKAGMHGFTKALALEVANKGITVNTISPGYVQTSMVKAIPEPLMASIVAQIPVGRLAQPEEIARVVVFLAAEESGFITGANIAVNGGQHMY